MEIATELRSVLNDNDEPLSKRLKIAQNALHSVELIGVNKEEILLDWFSKTSAKSQNTEVWEGLNVCLQSQQFQNFRQSEINQDILHKLIKTISKCLKDDENEAKLSIIECAKVILRNTAFRQFFKHNINLYCSFLSNVLKNINDTDEMNAILNDKTIFDQKLFVKTECCKIFLANVLPTLFDIVVRSNCETITNNVIKLVQKVILQNNLKVIEIYINKIFDKDHTDLDDLPCSLINELSNFYKFDLDKAQISFNIVINAFFETYKSQDLLYKFFVLILQMLAIENDFGDISLPNIEITTENDKSLAILADMFEIVSVKSRFSEVKLNKKSFDDFVKNILKTLVKTRKPDGNLLNILKWSIVLNPLIVDNLVTDIISNVMLLKKNEKDWVLYGNLVVSIFEMYSKLHRVHKFTSEILRTFKTACKEDVEICENVDDILPTNVLNYYEHCITQQSGKQIISIMRTFVVHLQDIVDNIQYYSTSDQKKLYVKTLTAMFCHFLYVVRVAEYNTTQLTVSKFCKDLTEMKSLLGKFGTELLNMEHDQPLMHCFLSLAEAWGDLMVILKYYSTGPNGSQLKDIAPIDDLGDYQTCNLTYIHGFLSAKQWSIVAQRIKNFGEKPCQDIMHKIIFQKVRAFLTLNSQNAEIDQTTLKNAVLNMNDNWEIILAENTPVLLLNDVEICIKMGEFIVNEFIQNEKIEFFQRQTIVSNKNLVTGILYSWFGKVNALFKIKRKHNETLTNKSLVTKIFKHINLFDEEKLFVFDDFEKCFNDVLEINVKINEQKLLELLEMLKFLPIWGLSENLQKIFFVFMLALRIDMAKNNFDDVLGVECTCENYLKGILESPWAPNFITVFSMRTLLPILVYNVKSYKNILTSLFNKGVKHNESITFLPKIQELERYENMLILEIGTKILTALNKANKSKISDENKEFIKQYKEEICVELSKILLTSKKLNATKLEAYVLLLPYFLQKDDSEILPKLIAAHTKYVEFCHSETANQETSLLLFEILLRNKTKINLESDFVSKTWTLCTKGQNTSDSCFKQLGKTVSLVFEYNSVEEFTKIINNLLTLTVVPLESENFSDFNNYLKIWHCLINSALSTVKQEIFFKLLVRLFENVIIYLIKNNDEDFDEVIVKLELDTINNKQITPTGNMIDIYLETVAILMSRTYDGFTKKFNLSLSIMSSLMETRKYFIIDRLPSYMANVRTILISLCGESHFVEKPVDSSDKNILDCAFQFEKLIRKICYLKKDMVRIAPYFIGDILKNYEKTVLIHGVKNYLDNCVFLLLEICDQHAISYLFRVLSPASTELFKNLYDNYNRYHKFAGRI